MSMGVDQAGHQQAIAGVDCLCVVGSVHARRPDLDNRVVLDEDIRRRHGAGLNIQQEAVADDFISGVRFGHGLDRLGASHDGRYEM